MRVLWIAPNGGNYKNEGVKGTGGWIGALQTELTDRIPNLELGIAFISASDNELVVEGKVTYIPFKTTERRNVVPEIWHRLYGNEIKDEEQLTQRLKQVIEEYDPDVVHVWGIENAYACVVPLIKRPCVVHIQGLLSLSIYIYLPPGFSQRDILKVDSPLKRLLHVGYYNGYREVKRRAEREIRVAKHVKNWIGRTDWDNTASQMLSPGSRYFHCEELMRREFSEARWKYHYDNKTLRIHSSIGSEWYKGIDVILNTACVLKEQGVAIVWNVYGVSEKDKMVKYFAKHQRFSPVEVGVMFHGRVDSSEIRDGLLLCDVFVHPSYIENSSNAIAEAMMLGIPTIAQYVGGNPTMLRDNSGVLVAPNEPYMLASQIMKMRSRKIAEGYSQRALNVANERQNTNKTVYGLMEIYNRLIVNK